MRTLITGATGFIGGHLSAALLARGDSLRALVRELGRAEALRRQGAELVQGDLMTTDSLQRAVEGVERVYHCAALVGDWLDPATVRRANVEGTSALLSACADAGVRRVVYVSSLAVLGIRHHHGTDESAPCRYSGDPYGDSKIDAEQLVRRCAAEREMETVILRPGFVYGPGDRQFLPRLLDSLLSGQFVYVGDGSKLLNKIYIEDFVQAALLADSKPEAAGQVYNLTDGDKTSLRDFVTFIAEYLGIPAPTRHVPAAAAWAACHGFELMARLTRSKEPPRLNRARLKFLYYNQHYSIEKARRELGYTPRFAYRQGLPPTLDWFRANGLLKG
jgi:2-alkyl-3-oxoalkanoate reductase